MRIIAGLFLCFLVLVYLGRLPEIVPFLVPFQLGKVSVLMGFAVIVAFGPRNLLSFVKDTPFGRWALVILALALVGVPFSVWPGGSLNGSISFIRTLLIASVLVGLAQLAGAQALRLSCVAASGILALLMIQETSMGRVAVGSSYDPNDIALLFVTFLPVVVAEALRGGGLLLRCLFWGIAGMMVVGIALTGSRGGILALAAVGVYALAAIKTRRWLLIPLLAVGAGLVLAMANESLWERFQALGDDSDYNLTDTRVGRLGIWTHGLGFIIRSPIVGVGMGQFGTATFVQGLGSGLNAHNSFVQIGAELGVFGLTAFIGMLVLIYRVSKKGSAMPFFSRADQLRYKALSLSLIGFCVGGFFLSQAYGNIFYTFMALASVMYLQLRAGEERAGALEKESGESGDGAAPHPDGNDAPPPPERVENAAGPRMTAEERNRLLAQGDALARKRKAARAGAGGKLL